VISNSARRTSWPLIEGSVLVLLKILSLHEAAWTHEAQEPPDSWILWAKVRPTWPKKLLKDRMLSNILRVRRTCTHPEWISMKHYAITECWTPTYQGNHETLEACPLGSLKVAHQLMDKALNWCSPSDPEQSLQGDLAATYAEMMKKFILLSKKVLVLVPSRSAATSLK